MDQSYNLRQLISQYVLRYWYGYLLGLFIAGVGAFLYLRYATPKYLVRATILIKDPNVSGELDSESMLLGDLGLGRPSRNILNEMQVLRSPSLMLEVVKELGLDVTYISVGRVRSSEAYLRTPVFLEKKDSLAHVSRGMIKIEPVDAKRFRLIDKDSIQILAYNLPAVTSKGVFVFRRNPDVLKFESPLRIFLLDAENVARAYSAGIGTKRLADFSSVLEVTLKDPNEEKARDIVNTLLSAYNKASINDKNVVSANTLRFIEERLSLLSGELANVERDIEAYKSANTIASTGNDEAARLYTELSNAERRQNELELQRGVVRYVSDYFAQRRNRYELLPANLSLPNPELNRQIDLYNQLLLQREKLLRTASEQHPSVAPLETQIADRFQNILEGIRQLELELNSSIATLQTNMTRYRTGISGLPRKERELLEIIRQQRIKETLYLYLLEKREETALSMAISTPIGRIVDPVYLSKKPVEPNRNLVYALAFLLGVVLPVGLAALLEAIRDTVDSEEEIKQLTSIPIFGVIGHYPNKTYLAVRPYSRSATAEMFRLLRTNLLFARQGNGGQVILVSSAVSGEGKSFVTLNLGMTLAIGEQPVVIAGFDLRKPKLDKYVGQEMLQPGLSQYLAGHCAIDEIIHPSALHPRLWLIPSGPIPPNPAELLQGERLDQLLAYLRERFTYTLLDSPPFGLVSDARLLTQHCDRTFFVVRQGMTKRAFLRRIEEEIQSGQLLMPAIIFNGVKSKHGGYGYGYGYGYYE